MIALDVGLGTQDILVDSELSEDSIKVVLPSPTSFLEKKVREIDEDVFFHGYTMGGGPLSKEICFLAEAQRVVMSEDAARTISDNLKEVREEGIEVVDSEESVSGDLLRFELGDLVSLPNVEELLDSVGVDLPSYIGVGVQDHGVAPRGVSDRRFRFKFFEEALREEKGFSDLVFTSKTDRFSRMDSVLDYLSDNGLSGLVMDSKLASVLGCVGENNRVIVDAGNGHFLGASCRGDELVGLFEHHTSQLTESKITYLINELVNGSLSNDEVFEDGGHGAFVREALDVDEIVVTGPNRNLMPGNLDYRFANPNGDVMMTGAVGLFRARKYV